MLNARRFFRLTVVLHSEFHVHCMCIENGDATIRLPRNWRCLSTNPSSKKSFPAESDNISRDEKYAFQTPEAYCVDCDPKREVQVFAAMHERRL
jgi:hypothetical protein